MKIEEKNGQLVIIDFNELEAYKIACKIEREGMLFYEKLIDMVTDEDAKEALRMLVAEEKKHLRLFKNRYYEIAEREEDSFESDDLLEYMDYGVVEAFKAVAERNINIKNSKGAIRLGIAVEERSVEFYGMCKERVSDPLAKEELEKIINEEKKHRFLLVEMEKRITL